jgi:hypothetical protein
MLVFIRLDPVKGTNKTSDIVLVVEAVSACLGHARNSRGKAGRLTYCRQAVPACFGHARNSRGKAGRLTYWGPLKGSVNNS